MILSTYILLYNQINKYNFFFILKKYFKYMLFRKNYIFIYVAIHFNIACHKINFRIDNKEKNGLL